MRTAAGSAFHICSGRERDGSVRISAENAGVHISLLSTALTWNTGVFFSRCAATRSCARW